MKKSGIALTVMMTIVLFAVFCFGTSVKTKAESLPADSSFVTESELTSLQADSSPTTAKKKTGLLIVFTSELLLTLGIICAAIMVKRAER